MHITSVLQRTLRAAFVGAAITTWMGDEEQQTIFYDPMGALVAQDKRTGPYYIYHRQTSNGFSHWNSFDKHKTPARFSDAIVDRSIHFDCLQKRTPTKHDIHHNTGSQLRQNLHVTQDGMYIKQKHPGHEI